MGAVRYNVQEIKRRLFSAYIFEREGLIMSKFCKNCGAQLKPDVKFCAFCGTETQETEASPQKAPRTVAKETVSEIKKTGIPLKKLFISAIAVVLILAIGAAILPRLGGKTDDMESMTGDLSSFAYSKKDYRAKSKELAISPEKPTAAAYGVSIDFGEYGLEKEETLEIKELPEKTDKKNGVKVTAYDFSVGNKTIFDDVISIAIPYDDKYAETGAESECVGAKYYNQATGEWEGVYYEVDTANRQVLIYTTHLSTYGVFQVKNENTRKAYITDVYPVASLLGASKSFEVLNELAEQGQPGNAAFEAGFEAINYVVGNTGNAVTVATLGGQYEGALADSLGKGTQHLGLALAAVQTCYDFTYKFSDDQEKMSTLSNLVKNLANNTVGYFGSSALQIGFAGVAVFDMLLSAVQSDMVELKLENLGGVYQYYNDIEAPRSNQEWRTIFIKALKENADDPQKAQQQINQEIDSYCDRFWSLDYGKVKEIAGVSGLKYSFDERNWTKDREVLTAQYKAHLLDRLQAPMTSARKYLLKQAMEQAQQAFEKKLRTLQRELNKAVKVQIIEQPEKNGEFQYGGYTVRFAPLSSNANAKSWSGKLSKNGEINTSFTVLGHMQSGAPSRIELYKPGENTPALTVPFKVSYPTTTILLSSSGKEEPKPEQSDEAQDVAQQPEIKEYVWVLVETRTNEEDMNDRLALANNSPHTKSEVSASSGSAVFTITYIGPDQTKTLGRQLFPGNAIVGEITWTAPTKTSYGPEDEVILHLTVQNTARDSKYPLITNWTVLAQHFLLDEKGRPSGSAAYLSDEDGGTSFTCGSGNAWQSFDVTVSAKLGTGFEEGARKAVRISASSGGVPVETYYIYEWKEMK